MTDEKENKDTGDSPVNESEPARPDDEGGELETGAQSESDETALATAADTGADTEADTEKRTEEYGAIVDEDLEVASEAADEIVEGGEQRGKQRTNPLTILLAALVLALLAATAYGVYLVDRLAGDVDRVSAQLAHALNTIDSDLPALRVDVQRIAVQLEAMQSIDSAAINASLQSLQSEIASSNRRTRAVRDPFYQAGFDFTGPESPGHAAGDVSVPFNVDSYMPPPPPFPSVMLQEAEAGKVVK